MEPLTFSAKEFNLGQLQDELVAAVPALAPVAGDDGVPVAAFGLSELDGTVHVAVYAGSEVAAEIASAIGAVVAAHVPGVDAVLRRQREDIVKETLAATDKWAARAYEEGVPMSAERIAYRKALRSTLADLATSTDPASVQLPAPPAP